MSAAPISSGGSTSAEAKRKATAERHDRNRAENEARHQANVRNGVGRSFRERREDKLRDGFLIKLTATKSVFVRVPKGQMPVPKW